MTSSTATEHAAQGLRVRLPSRAAGAYLLVAGLATAVYFVLPADVQSVWYVAIGLSAVAAIYLGATRNLATGRLPWMLFALGLLFEVAGDAIFSVYEIRLVRQPPAPTVGD